MDVCWIHKLTYPVVDPCPSQTQKGPPTIVDDADGAKNAQAGKDVWCVLNDSGNDAQAIKDSHAGDHNGVHARHYDKRTEDPKQLNVGTAKVPQSHPEVS